MFTTGSIRFTPPSKRTGRSFKYQGKPEPHHLGPYLWVYDCGSTTSKRLVTNAIERVKIGCAGERIDLLTISHFHNDHISGLVELLGQVGAKTVMLPWAHLWRRLLIGFDQGLREDDAEMLFFVDPVLYLTQEADGRFDRVLFVRPSEGDGPPIRPEPIFPPPTLEDSEDREKDDGPGDGISESGLNDLDVSGKNSVERVRILESGKSIPVLHGVWEFVPYNDPDTCPKDAKGFANMVSYLRESLLNSADDDREEALAKLRRYYEAHFGRASTNEVSLMLYGGAVGTWKGQRFCECDWPYHRLIGTCGCWKEFETRGAILLTGDGNLSNASKWNNLKSYLNAGRAVGTSVFQVAHHGALANWHDGLAAAVLPSNSVFSSDPRHNYGHPHAEVLRDFWPFRPVQVDQHSGFSVHMFLDR
nr:MBL fold metallo-hydrolase [Pseudoruegeria sp. HB172150]